MDIIQGAKDIYQVQKSKYDQYGELSSQVGKFNDVQSQLKEGWEIMRAVKSKVGNEHPLYKKFEKEYKELYEVILQGYESEKSFSQEERTKILLELGDMVDLAEKNGIIEKKGVYSWFGDVLRNTDTKDAKEKATAFRDKKAQDYTKSEAISAMSYLNGKYGAYKQVGNDDKLSKGITFNYSTINELDDQYEVRLFQDELVKKIFGEGKQFNNEFLVGFNNERGNYIEKTADFEKNLKIGNIENINKLGLKNYLDYLQANGNLNKQYLLSSFGETKTKEILEFMQRNKGDEKLKNFGYFDTLAEIGKTLYDTIKSVGEYLLLIFLSKTSQALEENIKLVDKLPQKEKEELIKKLEKELGNKNSQLRKIFLQPLLEKGKNEKEANEIVDKIIGDIKANLTVERLGNAYKVIESFNQEHGAKIDGKDTVNTAKNIETLNAKTQIIRAGIELEDSKKSGDIKKQKEAQKKLDLNKERIGELELVEKINSKLTQEQAENIGLGKESYENILSDLRKQDKDLDKDLKLLETQKFNDGNQNQLQSQQNTILYPDGTSLTYEQINSSSYSINTSSGDIEVSSKEFGIVRNNKEALKNLVNFKETLKKLNLSGLWNYRENIFKSISNKFSMTFDIKDDYLSEKELKIFLLSILKSVGIEPKNVNNFPALKEEIKTQNNVGVITGIRDVNTYGNSKIENIFINKFDTKRTGFFNQNVFEESLEGVAGINI